MSIATFRGKLSMMKILYCATERQLTYVTVFVINAQVLALRAYVDCSQKTVQTLQTV